jgi:inorganic triphosphatase YgiF
MNTKESKLQLLTQVAEREAEDGFFLSATRNEEEHRRTKKLIFTDPQLSPEDIGALLTVFSDPSFQHKELSLTELFSTLDDSGQDKVIAELQTQLACERQRLIGEG